MQLSSFDETEMNLCLSSENWILLSHFTNQKLSIENWMEKSKPAVL